MFELFNLTTVQECDNVNTRIQEFFKINVNVIKVDVKYLNAIQM